MPLLTAKDVAQRLNASPLTVIRLANAGALPAVEVAKREHRRLLRFREESVDKFIASRERRGVASDEQHIDSDVSRQTLNAVYATALACYDAGISFTLIKADGSKASAVCWEWLQHEPMYRENFSQLFKPSCGLAMIGGKVSGNLEILDFDAWSIYHAFLDLVRATGHDALVDRIRAGYEERTPRGAHLPYRCAQISNNTKLASCCEKDVAGNFILDERGKKKTKAVIETRGEGGYAIIGPSNGKVHETGLPYILLQGSLATIDTITPEERAEIWALCRSFNEVISQHDAEPKREPKEPRGDRPGDLYNARASWEEILLGWAKVYEHNGVTYWRRPEKHLGVSATTNYAGSDLLYVFSTSTPFESERGYSKFSAYTLLHHNNDFKKAAEALAQNNGYKPEQRHAARVMKQRQDAEAKARLVLARRGAPA